jgi:L-rhamnose mutarotase
MERVSFKMKLKKGFAAEYKKRHDDFWPELKILLKETGIHDYSIFLDPETNLLFAFLLIEKPERLKDLPAHEIMKKWWTYMKDIMDSNPDHSPVIISLEEVFYLP